MDEINKLFNLMGLDLNAVVSPMLESMAENIRKNPDIPASFWKFWDEYRKNPDIESLRNLYVDIYKRHYTQEEIAGLIRFYETPLGRKSTEKNQQITQECQTIGAAYFESLAQEVAEELLAEDS